MPPFLTLPRLVMLAFFLQPVAYGSWLPRIPEIQDALGLGPAALAVALLGMPVGTLLTLPFAGPLVGKIGARTAIIAGMIFYSIAACLPVLAPDPTLLFIALMLAGHRSPLSSSGLTCRRTLPKRRLAS